MPRRTAPTTAASITQQNKRSRSLFILATITFVCFCLLNIHLVARLDSTINTNINHIAPSSSGNIINNAIKTTNHISANATSTKNNNTGNKDDIIEFFRQAGVELDDESIRKLPTWEQIQSVIGDKPRLLGLERCEDFQKNVPPLRRMLGSAGMFNSGTNLITRLMKENCVIPERYNKYHLDPKATKEQFGIRWQCPWGKHTPVKFKYEHTAPKNENVARDDCLPIVTVRNPYDWMQSMCNHPYTARWDMYEGDGKKGVIKVCPHLADATLSRSEKPWPIAVKAKLAEQWLNYESLAHLWNDWYAQYWQDADFPFLMVRLEDLILRQYDTTKIVCNCAGGTVPPKELFKYIVDSAKQGPGHGKKEERTGMVNAWLKYGKPMDAKAGFTDLDWEASLEFLSRELMEKLDYKYPPSE